MGRRSTGARLRELGLEPSVVDDFLDFQKARIGSLECKLVQAAITRFMDAELGKQTALRNRYNALRKSQGKPRWRKQSLGD